MAIKTKWFGMIAIFLLFSSCYYDKEEILYPAHDCSPTPKKFTTDVSPIIQSKCSYASDCHGSGSTNSGGALTSYNIIKDNSFLIRHQILIGAMPKSGSLTS